MNHEVVVTGIGAVTPLGNDKEAYYEGLLKGNDGFVAYSETDFPGHLFLKNEVNLYGKIKHFIVEEHFGGAEISQYDQRSLLVLKAVNEALADAGLDDFQGKRGAVLAGTVMGIQPPYPRIQNSIKVFLNGAMQQLPQPQYYPSYFMEFFTETLVKNICQTYRIRDYGLGLTGVCASGSISIGLGYELISSGMVETVICIGFDFFHPRQNSLFSHFKLLSADKCRPFDKGRDGFQLAEAIGVAVLERAESAQARNAGIYGKIAGFGVTCDAYHLTIAAPKSEAYAEAIQIALENGGIGPADLDYICPAGRGGRYLDLVEAQALKKALGNEANRVPVNSIIPNIGYALGANTILNLIATLLQMKHEKIFPTLNVETIDPKCDLNMITEVPRGQPISAALVTGFAFTGINTAIVVQKY